MPPQGGTTPRRIRIDDDLWSRFGEAVQAVDPDSDRSRVIRRMVRWYLGEADLPERPATQDEQGT